MRDARSALIKVCEHRMRTSDAGNIDTFIILLNQMKRANNVLKLPAPKRRFGKMLNDCLDSMMQSTESLRGKSGAARVIFGHFSGRAASILHRRLTKEFHDVATQPAEYHARLDTLAPRPLQSVLPFTVALPPRLQLAASIVKRTNVFAVAPSATWGASY